MKLSVALCTFNGERFLREQLDSIAAQTRPPDELVVCDDASTDSSVPIVRDFAARVRFPVRLEVNAQTRGSTRNFSQAIARCSQRFIVLSDQDDVWLPHKLEALSKALASYPEPGFVFSDAEVVDAGMRPLGYSLWEAVRFYRKERMQFRRDEAFKCLLRRYRVTGATMAFRARYRNRILPIPPQWHHDAWIALVISALARCALVEEPLIRYRQHAAQQLGRPKRGLLAQYRVARSTGPPEHELEVRRYEALWERLDGLSSLGDSRRELLRKKLDHLHRRAAMRTTGVWRLPCVLREILAGNYGRFSAGWKSIAQDLLLR